MPAAIGAECPRTINAEAVALSIALAAAKNAAAAGAAGDDPLPLPKGPVHERKAMNGKECFKCGSSDHPLMIDEPTQKYRCVGYCETACKTCKEPMEYCIHCSGSDGSDDAGQGQGDGYWLCQNKECKSYQFCCGC